MENQKPSLLTDLKSIFPEASWEWVIPALHQEQKIWNALQEPSFRKYLRERVGNNPRDWTPTRIALEALNQELAESITLPLKSITALDTDVKERISFTFQEYQSNPDSDPSLSKAALLAMALLFKLQDTQSWKKTIEFCRPIEAWQLPLTIAYGLENEGELLLNSLPAELGLHILFSQPAPHSQIKDNLSHLLARFPIHKQTDWLSAMKEAQPDWTVEIANHLLSTRALVKSTPSIQDMQQEAFLYSLAGIEKDAREKLDRAYQKHREEQALLALQTNLLEASTNGSPAQTAHWKTVLEIVRSPNIVAKNTPEITRLLNTLLERGQAKDAQVLMDNTAQPYPRDAGFLTAAARTAFTLGNTHKAKSLADAALEKTSGKAPLPSSLAELYFQLNDHEKAIQSGDITLSQRPNDIKTLQVKAKTHHQLGDLVNALENIRLAAMVSPGNMEIRRDLAHYLQLSENWEDAYHEWEAIIEIEDRASADDHQSGSSLPVEDHRNLAECALRTDRTEKAITLSRGLIEKDPRDGLSHMILGEGYLQAGQSEEGLQFLQKAVELSPDQVEPWLALASYQKNSGQTSQALRNLQAGLNTVDKQSRLYLEMGDIYVENEEQTKALEAFRNAVQAADDHPGINPLLRVNAHVRLGQSLRELGHLSEARTTVQKVLKHTPHHPDAALEYGQILLEMGESRGALPYLCEVVDGNPSSADAYLALGRAYLGLGFDPESAVKPLQIALEKEPDRTTAHLFLGEAYLLNDQLQEARDSFETALQTTIRDDPRWSARIFCGLGKTLRKLGELETALTILQDGYRANPRSVPLMQELADAYREAGQAEKALAAAQAVYETDIDHPETLDWIADFALEMDSPQFAVPVLNDLLALSPRDSSTYLKLARAYRMQGEEFQAIKSYTDLIQLENPAPRDLLTAGGELIKLERVESAQKGLQKAVQMCEVNQTVENLLPAAYAKLAECLAIQGEDDEALELFDKAITVELNNPLWRKEKAALLGKHKRYQAALASLKHALDLEPEDPDTHLRVSKMYRAVKADQKAYEHAEKAHQLFSQDPAREIESLQALASAAQLAWSILDSGKAKALLSDNVASLVGHLSETQLPIMDGLCLYCELLLEENEEIEAAQLLNQIVQVTENHPRVKALQARLKARQGDFEGGRTVFFEAHARAVEHAGDEQRDPQHDSLSIALGTAAQELLLWDEAMEYFQLGLDKDQDDSRSLFALLRCLVLRAEQHRLASQLEVTHHLPGVEALGSTSKQLFRELLSELETRDLTNPLVQKWAARGEAVFWPREDTLSVLESLPGENGNVSALLAGLRVVRDPDKALEIGNQVFAKSKTDPQLAAQVAFALVDDQPDQALQAAENASSKTHHLTFAPALAYSLEAIIAERTGDRDRAYSKISEALSIWDDEARWHALAARTDSDPGSALEHWMKAIDLEPEYPAHYLGAGKTYQSVGQPADAVNILSRATTLAPGRIDLWLALAEAYRDSGDLNNASECAVRALEISPRNEQARCQLASLEMERGHYHEAEILLRELMDDGKHHLPVILKLADVLEKQERYQEAYQLLGQAAADKENRLSLELRKINLLKHLEGVQASLSALTVLARENPDHFQIILDMTKTLSDAGNHPEALRAAQRALKNPAFSDQQRSTLHTLIGRILRQGGHLDQAVYHLHKATELDPNQAEHYVELGRTEQDRRQYEQALEAFNQAIQIAPAEPLAYYHAGIVLKELNEYTRAEKMLRRAAQLAPHDLRIHRQLGVLVTLNLVHGDMPTLNTSTSLSS